MVPSFCVEFELDKSHSQSDLITTIVENSRVKAVSYMGDLETRSQSSPDLYSGSIFFSLQYGVVDYEISATYLCLYALLVLLMMLVSMAGARKSEETPIDYRVAFIIKVVRICVSRR